MLSASIMDKPLISYSLFRFGADFAAISQLNLCIYYVQNLRCVMLRCSQRVTVTSKVSAFTWKEVSLESCRYNHPRREYLNLIWGETHAASVVGIDLSAGTRITESSRNNEERGKRKKTEFWQKVCRRIRRESTPARSTTRWFGQSSCRCFSQSWLFESSTQKSQMLEEHIKKTNLEYVNCNTLYG